MLVPTGALQLTGGRASAFSRWRHIRRTRSVVRACRLSAVRAALSSLRHAGVYEEIEAAALAVFPEVPSVRDTARRSLHRWMKRIRRVSKWSREQLKLPESGPLELDQQLIQGMFLRLC